MLPWYFTVLLILAAYLLGSLPTGYLAGRWLQGIDIRQAGSGSTGATNVLRTLGKGPAIVVLIVDILKGALAVGLAQWVYAAALPAIVAPDAVSGSAGLVTLAGLAALLGHSKSIWLGFSGGKSVATSLGILLAMSWPVGLATLGVFAVCLALSRIVSLSSIAGAVAVMGLMVLWQQPWPYELFAIAGGIYVIWRHRSNVQRLLVGTEPRLGQKLTPEPEEQVGSVP